MITNSDHDDQIAFFSITPVIVGAEIMEYLEPELQYRIMDHLEKDLTIALLHHMSSDEVADLLLAIHPHQAKIVMELLSTDYREKIKN